MGTDAPQDTTTVRAWGPGLRGRAKPGILSLLAVIWTKWVLSPLFSGNRRSVGSCEDSTEYHVPFSQVLLMARS